MIGEHLAHLLNNKNIYNIPYTTCIEIEGKKGSIQYCVPDCTSVMSICTADRKIKKYTKILDHKEIQASLIFDMRFNNSDRHMGNLLVQKRDTSFGQVFMIDHRACMSCSKEDKIKIDQLCLPQTKQNWHPELKEYLLSLDDPSLEKDTNLMRERGIGEDAIKYMIFSSRACIQNRNQTKIKDKTIMESKQDASFS